MTLVLFVFSIGAACSFSVSPIRYADDKAAALQQAERFHRLINENRIDEAYEMHTPRFRSETTREKFHSDAEQFKTEAGKIIGYKNAKEPEVVTVSATTREVRFLFDLTTDSAGKLEEEFAFIVDGKVALIDHHMMR